jgi:ABC-type glycerol-3-phosphate transport system permease component
MTLKATPLFIAIVLTTILTWNDYLLPSQVTSSLFVFEVIYGVAL